MCISRRLAVATSAGYSAGVKGATHHHKREEREGKKRFLPFWSGCDDFARKTSHHSSALSLVPFYRPERGLRFNSASTLTFTQEGQLRLAAKEERTKERWQAASMHAATAAALECRTPSACASQFPSPRWPAASASHVRFSRPAHTADARQAQWTSSRPRAQRKRPRTRRPRMPLCTFFSPLGSRAAVRIAPFSSAFPLPPSRRFPAAT